MTMYAGVTMGICVTEEGRGQGGGSGAIVRWHSSRVMV